MDLILNGKAQGDVATVLLSTGFDVHALRPWIGTDGRAYITRNEQGQLKPIPVQNATLRKDEWKILDEAVVRAAVARLNLVNDLRENGLVYNIPNGLGKTVLETETMSDISGATISMDPAREGERDRPTFDLTNLPLPVVHKDFSFSARQIAVSRNAGTPLDTTMAEMAGRKVAEEVEKLAIGVAGTYSFGGGTVYGLTNFPNRITTTITSPEASGWTPAVAVQQVLNMRQLSEDRFHYGPWILYNSPKWDRYLDDDYSAAKGDNTLRERLEGIRGIQKVQTLDFLTGYQLILVQQTSDVIRLVMGLDITTTQWETLGGLSVHFKVMAIMVPQLRADSNGNTGIVHGSAA